MDAINANKLALYGNYDATYGKITNFSWSFEQDGTYNITLKILTYKYKNKDRKSTRLNSSH